MAVGDGGRAEVGGAFGPGGVTRLVGVPVLLTVVTEVGVAARPLTLQLGAARAPRRYNRIPTTQHIKH